MSKRDIRKARKHAEQQQWSDPYDDEQQTGDASDGCGDGDEDEQEQ
jgi:hypothetical protein